MVYAQHLLLNLKLNFNNILLYFVNIIKWKGISILVYKFKFCNLARNVFVTFCKARDLVFNSEFIFLIA